MFESEKYINNFVFKQNLAPTAKLYAYTSKYMFIVRKTIY